MRRHEDIPNLLAAFEKELAKAPEGIRTLCENRMVDARPHISALNTRKARAYLEGLENELKHAKAPVELQKTFDALFDTIWYFT